MMCRPIFPLGLLLAPLLVAGSCQMTKPTAPPPAAATPAPPQPAAPLWKSAAYALYPDSVVQGRHVARALSRRELVSNYQSPANQFLSPRVSFKFSLNGKDNEMPPGQDHIITALPRPGGAGLETPLIVFGRQYVDPTPVPAETYLAPNTPLKIRLDMRPVLAAFKQQGYYQLYNGQKLYQQDLKHVLVAGNAAPLSWDFDNLVSKPGLELTDPDGDGIYETTLTLNAHDAQRTTAKSWKASLDVSGLPQYESDYPLLDALYNLALEEAKRAVEPDGTFRTGQEWAGVWTRDISYSIILAQAAIQPEVAKTSLLRKVTPEGRIIQDTGTGGAYPVSTDRMIWAVAAWEVYLATGDEDWLRRVYPIVKKSLAEDTQNNIYDATRGNYSGLVRGETSFLDWREQTYPKWMQPVDIYQSTALSTSVVHAEANYALMQMAWVLEPSRAGQQAATTAAYRRRRNTSGRGINTHLWREEQATYAAYRYGRTTPERQLLAPRAEALGTALAVLFEEALEPEKAIASTPVMDYGVPCVYPQTPGIPPYHNNAVWPFVQSFWGLAAAKAQNETAFLESIAAVSRPAALFLTNKENFVASNGDYAGTQVNSSNMLWSLSGTLGLVYKGLFGLRYEVEGLTFEPFVPQALRGTRRLTGLRYRQATLDVELMGFGNQIRTITLDGQPLPNGLLPASTTGPHAIRIELTNESLPPSTQNKVPHHVAPMTPQVRYAAGRLSWAPVDGAKAYQVLLNGQFAARTTEPEFVVPRPASYAEYQVVAVDAQGYESFASEPLPVEAEPFRRYVQLETAAPKSAKPYKGYTGKGFLEISKTVNRTLTFSVDVPAAGEYALDFRYANGNGPINTSNKCALRSLYLAGRPLGLVVLPQRGVDEWSDWGYSNSIPVSLPKGRSTFSLRFEAANENMNGEVNQAMLDHLRLTRLR
ncbi:glycogen debranching protein [Hymenobacter gummosus]|uniref:Glycogen debranching protein n=1 Tax=Hymenobacter gummosus TaxID=1776032 RepID=A0A3S0K1R4_9BACT|nr:glycogen debranching protein [Hymenobacter gummosus]RTQ45892.1 glycogen debranching protein [Hymenobacter gummosus]